jgi:hypothetical protein
MFILSVNLLEFWRTKARFYADMVDTLFFDKKSTTYLAHN